MNTTHAAETLEEARVRLAAKARQDGVTLTVEEDGRHYASSTSKPGTLHYVTGYSCDCVGFANRGRCKHHSALLSAMGWLDDADPEPTPPVAAVAITHVPGAWGPGGWLVSDGCPVWQEPLTEIMIDGEVNVRIEGDTFGLSVHWIEQGRPIDNLTACTPVGLDHYGAVKHWIEALDHRAPAYIPMQAAGLFGPAEFIDEEGTDHGNRS